jgi:putative flippase GtrA
MTQTSTAHTATTIRRNPIDALILSIARRFGSKSKEVERFLKFAVVGVIGFVVDLGTLIVLQATILPPLNTLNVAAATTVAFMAAIASNFTWNRFWTYPDSRSRSVRLQVMQFTFISVVGWLARTVWISAAYLGMGALLFPLLLPLLQSVVPSFAAAADAEARVGTMAAQIVGVVVVMFWNFFANRYWTYNDVDAATPEQPKVEAE